MEYRHIPAHRGIGGNLIVGREPRQVTGISSKLASALGVTAVTNNLVHGDSYLGYFAARLDDEPETEGVSAVEGWDPTEVREVNAASRRGWNCGA